MRRRRRRHALHHRRWTTRLARRQGELAVRTEAGARRGREPHLHPLRARPSERRPVKAARRWITLLSVFGAGRGHSSAPRVDWTPGTSEREVRVGDDTRSYVLLLPAAVRRNRIGVAVSYPLMLVLHGSGADGQTVERQSGMDRLADSAHFIVAYPNGETALFGLRSDWNAGKCCGSPARGNVDDIAFFRATIGDIARHVPVDRRRVYVAGFSDGGRMAYRVACDAASMVAAIGVVAGSVVDDTCRPARPVPLIVLHGTADGEGTFSA